MTPRILALALAASVVASAADTTPKKVLFFSRSAGYEHSVIRDPSLPYRPSPGSEIPGLAFKVMSQIAARENLDLTFSKDGRPFSPEYLAQFDAFVFMTTGDLTQPGGDGNPPMTPAGKQALLDAVAAGKGFVGIHCATDTFHSASYNPDGPGRYSNDGAAADPFVKMLGGEFVIHGSQQPSHLIVADPRFPGVGSVPAGARFVEEWYSLKNLAPDLHAILVQDTSGMVGNPYDRPNYPSTWARLHGKGRVFYTSMGHRDDVWKGQLFQGVLAGGINWALGRVDADVTPNLAVAAPGAAQLPHYLPPKQP